MLLRAFYNLLSNAIKHIGSDKKVIIKISKAEAGHRISVRDSGDGIKKEDIPYIWNRYHSGRMGGTGIGLSIAEAVFKRHGFRFGVESEEGEGSEFWFEA
jgi:signal transduction histidine kinase